MGRESSVVLARAATRRAPPQHACCRRLGLYAALKKLGPCTAAELAAHLELNQRYVAEWLRQQAAARVISADADAGKVGAGCWGGPWFEG